ncbi:Fic family protein [Micromonospora sp. NPDC047707]|uniref:Fic family protein n=1 Tax=Micromonospora sp. NPDC047707 TaxID=3154498 RepID=UPI00345158AC
MTRTGTVATRTTSDAGQTPSPARGDAQPEPDLFVLAVVHHRFEVVHPFLDGDGRAGRLVRTVATRALLAS